MKLKNNFFLNIIFFISSIHSTPVVTIRVPGLLGNQLFLFCIGKIISQELGFKLNCLPIYGFPETYNQQSLSDDKYPIEKISGTQDININEIISNKTPRNIEIGGYFQRAKYYEKYKDEIRKNWLKIDPQLILPPQDPDDLVIHIRYYPYPHFFIPFTFYQEILNKTHFKQLYICTDEPNDIFLENFKQYNPIIKSTRSLQQMMDNGASWESISKINLDDFLFIQSFNKIIISKSTYAWWAAYLSNAKEIYAPICSDEWGFGQVNEERYHYTEPTKYLTDQEKDALQSLTQLKTKMNFNQLKKIVQSFVPTINQFLQAKKKKNQSKINQLNTKINRIKQKLNKIYLEQKNNDGQTFLMTNPRLSRFLLLLQKTKAKKLVNIRDNDGNTVLNYIINNANLYDKKQFYKPLIKAGIHITNIDIKNLQAKSDQNKKVQKIIQLLQKHKNQIYEHKKLHT